MANFSDYIEQQIFNHIFRDDTFAKPTTIAIALTTGVLLDSQTGATIPEMPNSLGYARIANASGDSFWDAHGTDGPGDNASLITFAQATGDWAAPVSGVAIIDNTTYGAGNVLMWGYLDTPRTVTNGDNFKFNAGNIDITIA